MLVDGGEYQLDCVLELCGATGNSTVIVDVIHVLEYVWDAGREKGRTQLRISPIMRDAKGGGGGTLRKG